MKETDCRKCCVCAFKEDLCNGDFCEKYYREGNTEDFEKLLPHWIPCSERLPDRFGKMLVTFIPAAGTLWTQVIIAHYSDLMGVARPCFWIGTVGKNDFANITSQVVAWMPLPEPYRGEQE